MVLRAARGCDATAICKLRLVMSCVSVCEASEVQTFASEHVIGAWAFADAFQVADLTLGYMCPGNELNIMTM